jgi:putative oxygen-independent coproporphyrinogen III oxidase
LGFPPSPENLEHRPDFDQMNAGMNIHSPRSAYIHIPFCQHRCGYCNFSVVARRPDLVEPLLAAISTEMSNLKRPREVDTLYFGGGTPTLLVPEQLRRLGEMVLRWHPIHPGYEWTVEANPADVDAERIDILAQLGVNRLSLGAQSFHHAKLALLERNHSAEDITRAVDLARSADMRISLDLIFAAPGETVAQWQEDLQHALELPLEHLSVYSLTFERGTTFWSRRRRGELVPLAEELELAMYVNAIECLEGAGFEHYEISNFARPGHRSRHNESCWKGEEYFAAGPGASRYVDGIRATNHRSTTTYLKRIERGDSPVAQSEQLDADQRAHEQLVFGLRRLEGVDRQEFAQRNGLEIDRLAGEPIRQLVELGMLVDDGYRVRLSRQGLLVSDAIWPELL